MSGIKKMILIKRVRRPHLLCALLDPRVVLHRADVQILPQNQDVLSLVLEDKEPRPIKEEQRKVIIKQEEEEGECTFTPSSVKCEDDEKRECMFIPRSVKSEDDEVKLMHLYPNQCEVTKDILVKGCGLLRLKSEPQGQSDSKYQNSSETWEYEGLAENTGAVAARSHGPRDCCSPEPNVLSNRDDELQNSSYTEDSEDWAHTSPVLKSKSGKRCTKRSLERSNTEHEPLQRYNTRKRQTRKSPNYEELFCCSECNAEFRQNENLICHMTVHTEKKPFCCSVCNREFTRLDNLKTHMLMHKRKMPYSCTVCKRGFPREDKLHLHMSVHTGEKPYSCTVCLLSFRIEEYLKAHMRIHVGKKKKGGGEKFFRCSYCKKCFSHNATLKKHVRSHTDERPFTCSQCGLGFKQSAHLSSHLSIHTGERPFSCPQCKKSFKRRTHVTLHMKVHSKSDSIHTAARCRPKLI